MERHLANELLDQMAPENPAAIRSRRDLRRINGIMGNEQWILKRLREIAGHYDTLIEIGAGEGSLLVRIHSTFPCLRCAGYDLIPRPEILPDAVEWVRGNVLEEFDAARVDRKTIIVANLVLHHFCDRDLLSLCSVLKAAGAVIVVEPDRARSALWFARALLPFVNYVTRFDMMASIRAGFRAGELEGLFGKRVISTGVWLGGRRICMQ